VFGFDVVRDAAILGQVQKNHIFLGGASCFFYRELSVPCFTDADADAALFVAQDYCSREIEATTACHDASNAAEADELLGKLRAFTVVAAARASAASAARTTASARAATATRLKWFALAFARLRHRHCLCIGRRICVCVFVSHTKLFTLKF